MRTSRWKAPARFLALALIVLLCLLPLLWTLLAAFGLEPDDQGWKGAITLDHFGEVGTFDPAFTGGFSYTLFVTVLGTLITLVCALPAAYRLVQLRHKRVVGVIIPFLLVLAVIPVIGYGLPLSDLARRLGLYGNFVGLALAYAGIQLPLAIWVLRGYLLQLPSSLEEAAILEGASWATVLWWVVFPLVLGGVVATGVLVFVLNWNLFLLPSLLTERSPQVLPMVMRDFFAFERELEWPTAAAALLTSLAPAFILVLVGQRALDKFTLIPTEVLV
jgi:ABC-type glycerol-3-phosphate transport system permease component